VLLRLQAAQVIRGALRVGGGAENGALVLFQHLQPVAELGGVVVADFRRDAEVRASDAITLP
jgi:hypothetical protein